MKWFAIFLLFAVCSFATNNSLQRSATLPDSIASKIKNEQRIEQLNVQIAKMKNVSECNMIKKATVKEKEYCRTRFLILHPEFEDE